MLWKQQTQSRCLLLLKSMWQSARQNPPPQPTHTPPGAPPRGASALLAKTSSLPGVPDLRGVTSAPINLGRWCLPAAKQLSVGGLSEALESQGTLDRKCSNVNTPACQQAGRLALWKVIRAGDLTEIQVSRELPERPRQTSTQSMRLFYTRSVWQLVALTLCATPGAVARPSSSYPWDSAEQVQARFAMPSSGASSHSRIEPGSPAVLWSLYH